MAATKVSSLAWLRVTAWMGLKRLTPRSPNTCRYRSPASAPSELAVLMTTIRAAAPPASDTNRLRMTRSRTLSSAPPITMTVPSATD